MRCQCHSYRKGVQQRTVETVARFLKTSCPTAGRACAGANFFCMNPIRRSSVFMVLSHRELGDESILPLRQVQAIRNSL